MTLTDTTIRAAKPRATQYKLGDAGGLFILVRPTGGKLWRMKYRVNGKEKLLCLGRYPDVGLKEARLRREEAREALAKGKDPATEKKRNALAATANANNTFSAIAEELIAKRRRERQKSSTLDKARWFLSLLDPALGKRPIAEISPAELLAILRKVEADGRHETANRMRSFASSVFRYAIVTARTTSNPAAELQGALTAPQVRHHAAILEPNKVGALLRAIEGYDGQMITRLALKLAPHVFVRPGELRHAEWSEIDLEGAVWRIPATKMKMNHEHPVPLSRQAADIFREAQNHTGQSKYVFPSIRSNKRPMSENTITAALRRMGYGSDEMTAHGFRSIASTLLNESGKWSSDAIERALAHQERDKVRAAYHRGNHWAERVQMAQWWSDHLDGMRNDRKPAE